MNRLSEETETRRMKDYRKQKKIPSDTTAN